MDLSQFRVTGVDNPAKQVSVTRWHDLLDTLEENSTGFTSAAEYGLSESASGADNATALANAIAAATSVLFIPPGTYQIATGIDFNFSDVTILGHGATLQTAITSVSAAFTFSGGNIDIKGLRLLLPQPPTSSGAYVNVTGPKVRFHDRCVIEYTAETDGQALYVRQGGSGFEFVNSAILLNNAAIFTDCSDVLVTGCFFDCGATQFGDDCLAIKAINGAVDNIRFTNNQVHRYAAVVGIGSQIGTLAADDLTYSKRARNITIVGNVMENCTYGLYIKPGALANDYRHGLVEGVTYSDNILFDVTGNLFQIGIRISAGRGAIVRDVKGSNNIVVARAWSNTSGDTAGMLIGASGGGATPTIEDIDVEMLYRDPFGGVANGSGGATGYPVSHIVYIKPAGVTLDNINLRIEGDGCSTSGVFIESGADNAVNIERLRLDNVNVIGTSANGGIRTASIVNVMTDNIAIGSTGAGSAKVIDSGGAFIHNANPLRDGGTVTQATSKVTGVTLNTASGQITMNAAALAADTTASFVLTNSQIASGDVMVLNHVSGGTLGSYTLNARCAAGSATIDVRNITAASLSEAIVIGFALVKGATS